MTPAARVQAAIEVLDVILSGTPAEKALVNWARSHRFAGSGDRAAIRDHVFGAIRRQRSLAILGGSNTGRGLMIGALRANEQDIWAVFNGERYAPQPLTQAEAGHVPRKMTDAERLDCPDWLMPELQASLGPDFETVMTTMQSRAPVFLRVNGAKATRHEAIDLLAIDEVLAEIHPIAETALLVTGNPRRIRQTKAYGDGIVELQDGASQAAVEALPDLEPGSRILDYCAGGGGKTLAMAARYRATVVAHDAIPGRMADLPARAKRAGAMVEIVDSDGLARSGPFDLVLCDVPCSGSGAWRRQPEAKWSLTRAKLDDLLETQAGILDRASQLVAKNGTLAYATCSMLASENGGQIAEFVKAASEWGIPLHRRWTPQDGADGFALFTLTRNIR